MAVAQRRQTDVIHHSDHGRSVGDAYENVRCESFFATLECELLDRHRFRSQADARLAVCDFIEGWYNPRRRHLALDYLSPMIYERSHAIDHRTMASGSTIVPRGWLSRYPPRCWCSHDLEAVHPPPNRGNSKTHTFAGTSKSCQRGAAETWPSWRDGVSPSYPGPWSKASRASRPRRPPPA
jgi:hypothetical protein